VGDAAHVRRPGRWLDPARVRFICGALLACCVTLLLVLFATHDRGRSPFRPPRGADFTGFYTAGTTLLPASPELPADAGLLPAAPERLYDNAFQDRLYHALFPNLPEGKKLPYVHPPFVALFFRPFARLPYAWAFAAWTALSAALYLAGLALVLRTCPALTAADRSLPWLLALSFEPFVVEAWMGGQLSAFGFFCLALAWYCDWHGRPFASGLALGLCLYKPTLLVVLLPLLLVAWRFRTLLGFAACGLALAGVAVVGVGGPACLDFGERMVGFARVTSHDGTLQPPLYKFVDLNSFFRLLLGEDPWRNRLLLLAVAAVPLGLLFAAGWRLDRADPDRQRLVWAAALAGTTVFNLYVGIYDTVVVVLAAALLAEVLLGRPAVPGRALPPGFTALLVVLYVVLWLTQPLARATGFQLGTLVLLGLTVYALYLLRAPAPAAEPATVP
jgi:hypothetical protein